MAGLACVQEDVGPETILGGASLAEPRWHRSASRARHLSLFHHLRALHFNPIPIKSQIFQTVGDLADHSI